MASRAEFRALSEAHRVAQARIGAVTTRQVLAASPLLDVEDLDRTAPGWLGVVMAIVDALRPASARLAADYLRTARTLELGQPFEPVVSAGAPPRAVATSLVVTGPVAAKVKIGNGAQRAEAYTTAQARSAAAAARHVLNAGRQTIVDTIAVDPEARGFTRVISGGSCSFCAGLAGSIGSENFEAHDNCSCSAEPVY